MKICKIMRGLPGSGKSYWANKIPSAKIISTDSHFLVQGKYVFDVTKLGEYHNKTLLQAVEEFQKGTPTVVVDNTNIKVFEIAPYYRLAEAFGYEVEIIWVIADTEKCKSNNVHNVPPHVIDGMVNGIESLPFWWKVRVVINS